MIALAEECANWMDVHQRLREQLAFGERLVGGSEIQLSENDLEILSRDSRIVVALLLLHCGLLC